MPLLRDGLAALRADSGALPFFVDNAQRWMAAYRSGGPIQPVGGGQDSTIDTTMTVTYGAVSP